MSGSKRFPTATAEPATPDYATQADGFDPCDKPLLWTEPKRPRSSITVDEINKRNSVFWNELEPPTSPPDPIAVIHAHVMREVARESAREAVADAKRAMRVKGTKNSVDRRRAKIAARNQGWLDAHASGKTPKQIYLDQFEGRAKKKAGKKTVSLSTINRALKRASPP